MMVVVIHIMPKTLIYSEHAFSRQHERTIVNALVLPRAAQHTLDLVADITKRALYHPGSDTYAFMHGGQAWRAMQPLVLFAPSEIPHWRECKACRDGEWCAIGLRIIAARVQGVA
ncbi:MAG: hypothetical protein KGH75_00580 [Rhodospirillales bacterium]|nr:hypothetical protein [Rhodospirillales bacterium]